MAYNKFDELVTRRYHVVVRNWPLKKFCNPSAITSRIELDLLYNSWNSGATYFEKLTCEEMEVWENNQFSSRMESTLPPFEPVPALDLLQASPVAATIPSGPSHQDHADITLVISPDPLPNVPLTPVMNLAPGLTPTTTPFPPAPNPDVIAMMIQADPTLQNVDPALIAMGITGSVQRPMGVTLGMTPTEQQPNHTPNISGSKRRWQEVVTPLSYDVHAAKKPRKQRKDKHLQNLPVV